MNHVHMMHVLSCSTQLPTGSPEATSPSLEADLNGGDSHMTWDQRGRLRNIYTMTTINFGDEPDEPDGLEDVGEKVPPSHSQMWIHRGCS